MPNHSLSGAARRVPVILVALAAAVLGGLVNPAHAEVVARLEAADNVEAAIAWSTYGFAPGSVDTVLLARDDVFADALASGAPQGLGAPLLLTGSDGLDARVEAELDRLFPDTVVLLGGEQALSAFVAIDVADLGYDVDRIDGPERLSTAAALANAYFSTATAAILARASGTEADPSAAFADALAAGADAAVQGVPILLSDSAGLSPVTADYLTSSDITTVTIVGGEAALSAQVGTDLEALGIAVSRVAGATRDGTARALADLRFPDAPPQTVLLVEGQGPDAWASGFPAASVADEGTAVLLTRGAELPAESMFGLDGAVVCGPLVDASACDLAAEG